MASILIVDDDDSVSSAIQRLLERRGHTTRRAATGAAALAMFSNARPDLLLLDLTLPDTSGVELLTTIRSHDSQATAVFLTAFGSVRSAVDAIRAGGFDFLTKPFDNDELILTINRALEFIRLDRRVAELEAGLEARESFSAIVGSSEAIRSTVQLLAKVARVDATVLLLGESGTGKELAARCIHRHSARAANPFIAINCAALPPTLAESELFGHERGAFTDAREARVGRFEQASSGTLFLDEVGDLAIDLQAKLLRTLQESEVWRIGSRRATRIDVRIIAATNRDLNDLMARGQFRDDLFFRLNLFPITLPPLRERRVDLPLLVEHLLGRLNERLGLDVQSLSTGAMARLARHSWPGNVRELENVLARGMILTDTDQVREEQIQLSDRLTPAETPPEEPRGNLDEMVAHATRRVERTLIQAALNRAGGNRTAAAYELGVSRRTLFTKLKALKLSDAESDEAL